MLTLSFIAGAAWIYLVIAHHGFWREQRLPARVPEPTRWPEVVAIVPARNETATIGLCLAALTAQDYPGPFRIILVDDASTDGTADLARTVGDQRLTVIDAAPLQAGWTGKLAALNAGVSVAGEPGFYWFTDADVVHAPHVLRQLVAVALHRKRDLVSLMVRLHCESFWERAVIPAFVFFFQMIYPFRAVNDDRSTIAAAAGGCILLRREALERISGLFAIRNAVIDDCALARLVKNTGGGGLWLGLADDSHSLRAATSLVPLWQMIARTAFVQLRYSYRLLLGTMAGLVILFAVPPLATLQGLVGDPVVMVWGVVGWGAMTLAYRPTARSYDLPIIAAFTLPLTALLYALITLSSAFAHWRGRGSTWKGRHYDSSAAPANLPESR